MLNLLPEKEKKLVEKEVSRRIVVFVGLALFFVLVEQVIFSSLLFFSIDSYRNNLESRLFFAEKLAERGNFVSLEAEVDNLNAASSSFKKGEQKRNTVSGVVFAVLNCLPAGVKIDSFLFEPLKMQIGGRAETRENFLRFVSNLKKENSFVGIESPISNLLAEMGIKYSLTVYLNNSQNEKEQ